MQQEDDGYDSQEIQSPFDNQNYRPRERPPYRVRNYSQNQYPQLKLSQKIALPLQEKDSQIILTAGNTFIVNKYSPSQNTLTVSHVNAKGQQLAVLVLQNATYKYTKQTMIMLNEHELAILARISKRLSLKIWNIHINELVEIELGCDQHFELFYFKDSDILCTCLENKPKKQKPEMIISYYKLPLKNNDKPFHTVTFPYTQNRIEKLNQHSKICFIADQFDLHNPIISFCTYYLNEENKGEFVKYQFEHKLNLKNYKVLLAKLCDIWQVQPDVYYFKIETEVDLFKEQQLSHTIKNAPILDYLVDLWAEYDPLETTHHFYYYAKQNNIKNSKHYCSTSPYCFQFVNSLASKDQKWTIHKEEMPLKERIQSGHDCYNSYRQSFYRVPVYYIDPYSEEILANHSQDSRGHQKHYYWPSYKSEKMMIYVWDYTGSVANIEIYEYPSEWIIYKCRLKLISIFFLESLEESFDEDLLTLISEMLD